MFTLFNYVYNQMIQGLLSNTSDFSWFLMVFTKDLSQQSYTMVLKMYLLFPDVHRAIE